MERNENTPVRFRTVMEEAYANTDNPEFQFIIPQPFTAEHVQGVTSIGASPTGVANQLNQVLAENLSNNMASKIRAAMKAGTALPGQPDMDALYATYDFSGTRSAGTSNGSMFDRIFNRIASAFIRKLIKRKGYRDIPAPVTVAKRDELPKEGQISLDDFEVEVARLVSGEGPWSEVQAFISVREGLMEDAREEEAAARSREAEAEQKLVGLGL